MGVDDFRDDFPMEKKEERVFDQYRFEVFSPIAEKECQQLVRLGFLLDLGKGRFSFTDKMKNYLADFINNQEKFYEFLNTDSFINFKSLGEKGIVINNPEPSYVFPAPAKIAKADKAEETKTKKFFYDTEFLEGTQKKRFLGIPYGNTSPTIDLISIGIVSEDEQEYYAVSKDFNVWEAWNRYDVAEQTNYEKDNGFSGRKIYWIRENVLYPIFYDLFKKHNKMEVDDYFGNLNNFIGDMERDMKRAFKIFKSLISLYGKSRKKIAEEVQEFIIPKKALNLLPRELWGYYSDYDHVVFCWLFGKMLDLPEGFPMYTKDLKQSYDFYNKNFKKRKSLSAVMPHLIDFENLKDHPDYPKQENEHNALSDARWNKKLYEFLKSNK